jgi:two-component system CheB/CheR fusion protein
MAELASLLQTDYKGRFDERAERYLEWIRENGQQLMARIEEVLRLARIGSVREIVEAVDPREVIQDVLKGCAEQIDRSRARIQVAEVFPRVACNRVHLFQILDNLVRNALAFSSNRQPPELEIGVRSPGKEPLTCDAGEIPPLVVFVRDNGIGIGPDDRERIFQPFERLKQHEAPGTGIGLAIVKKITELYQGKVWVESELDRGSTFYFTLPLYGEMKTAMAAQKVAEA